MGFINEFVEKTTDNSSPNPPVEKKKLTIKQKHLSPLSSIISIFIYVSKYLYIIIVIFIIIVLLLLFLLLLLYDIIIIVTVGVYYYYYLLLNYHCYIYTLYI